MPVILNSSQHSHTPQLLTNIVSNKPASLPALFISHGTPKLAIQQSAVTNALARMGQNLPKPQVIVIMSAHWQSQFLEINSNPTPETWHDFTGFEPALYQLSYPAKGYQAVAEALAQQLNQQGIRCLLNPIRAFDHGVWVPLIHMYPHANVPIVQISLPNHFDAHSCYQLGAAMTMLRYQRVLLIASGSITHNQKRINWQANNTEDPQAKAFKHWLINHLKTDIPKALNWQNFTGYRNIHPTDEHLLPLFFALGAGQRVSVVHQSTQYHSLGMDILRFD